MLTYDPSDLTHTETETLYSLKKYRTLRRRYVKDD